MTTITALPTPPTRNDPTNFPARGDAFMAALPTFVTETNLVAGEVNTNATNAATAASNASTSAGNALTSANNAASSASTALNAPGTSATSTTSLTVAVGTQSLTIQTGKLFSVGQPLVIAYTTTPTIQMAGVVTSYNPANGALVVNVTTIAGTGTYTAWTVSLGVIVNPAPSSLNRVTRTSNTALTSAEQGKLIDVTSGTFTQTTATAASLGINWWCYLQNSGTGVVTYGTLLMPQGSQILLQSDGTTITVVLQRMPPQILIVRDEKAQGTQGDTLSASAWQQRTLNTVGLNTIPGASLASNSITLPAGTYQVYGSTTGYNTASSKSRLQGGGLGNFLYSVQVIPPASGVSSYNISGSFTLAAGAAVITFNSYSTQNQQAGVAFNIAGITEVYTELVFTKIA